MGKKAFCVVFLALLFCVALSSTASAVQGLIGWWKLDEGMGTLCADSSGLGNDGTFGPEGAPQWVAGKFGGGVYLDGNDDYIDIAPNAPCTIYK